MARVFDCIRVYDVSDVNKKQKGIHYYIEFVYESSKVKDFIKKYIISDEGTYKSYKRDGKLANSPKDYYEFIEFISDLKINEETEGFDVFYMSQIPFAYVRDEKSPLFVESKIKTIDIDEVIEIAKKIYAKKKWNQEEKESKQAVFVDACKSLLDSKRALLKDSQEDDEPGSN